MRYLTRNTGFNRHQRRSYLSLVRTQKFHIIGERFGQQARATAEAHVGEMGRRERRSIGVVSASGHHSFKRRA